MSLHRHRKGFTHSNGGIFKYSPEYSLTTYLNFVLGFQSLRQFLCAFNNRKFGCN
uniref:Uncharacterized protein n=1 Tax=viral metagenome TaxID=1070528 RepID=A0A6C0I0V8_9ZZZZ